MSDLLDTPIKDILGEPSGNPPSKELLALIQTVVKAGCSVSRIFVDHSYFNDRVDITISNPEVMMGFSVYLDDKIDYALLVLILTATHHHEWHKPISLGGLTIAPLDRIVPRDKIGCNGGDWKSYKQWYPPLVEQQECFKDDTQARVSFYKKMGVEEEVKEIQRIIKGEINGNIP